MTREARSVRLNTIAMEILDVQVCKLLGCTYD
jgi:hypothetical protein